MLEANANPDDIRQGWGTVLQFAAIQCREPIVKYLLEAKADVNLHCKGYFGGVRHPQKWVPFDSLEN